MSILTWNAQLIALVLFATNFRQCVLANDLAVSFEEKTLVVIRDGSVQKDFGLGVIAEDDSEPLFDATVHTVTSFFCLMMIRVCSNFQCLKAKWKLGNATITDWSVAIWKGQEILSSEGLKPVADSSGLMTSVFSCEGYGVATVANLVHFDDARFACSFEMYDCKCLKFFFGKIFFCRALFCFLADLRISFTTRNSVSLIVRACATLEYALRTILVLLIANARKRLA